MAEFLEKSKVIEDDNAPIICHVTSWGGFILGGKHIAYPSDKPSDKMIEPPKNTIIIPSDKLFSVKDTVSVYGLIILNKVLLNSGRYDIPISFLWRGSLTKEEGAYLTDNMKNYTSTINDARRIFRKLVSTLMLRTNDTIAIDKIADKVFLKFGFVKVYSVLKEGIEPDLVSINNKQVLDLDALDAKYPGIKNIALEAIDGMFEAMDFDWDKLSFREEDYKQLIAEINNKISKTYPNLDKNDFIVQNQQSSPANPTQSAPLVSGAASIAAPLPKAPVDSEPPLTRGVYPDGNGGVDINLTEMVGGNPNTPPVNATLTPTVVEESAQQIETQTVTPPDTQPPVTETVQPQPQVRKTKTDMKDVNPTGFKYPVGGIVMERKEEFVSHNPSLQIIENKLGPDFRSVYRNDGNFIYADIYSTADNSKVDWMSMTIDLGGHVFGKAPKFWPGSDNKEPVDFVPALHLSDEAVTAYWNRDNVGNIPREYYCCSGDIAKLNRKIELKSLFENIPSEEDAKAVMNKLCQILSESPEFDRELSESRAAMTQYKDVNNFVLETPVSLQAYCGGPTVNQKNIRFVFYGESEVKREEFFIRTDTSNTILEMARIPRFI